jgi:methylthioribose-1-phosphate isomerase
MPLETVTWKDGKIRMIDQTRLPLELVYLEIDDLDLLCSAIRNLSVRGAPAIGIAAAFGVVIGLAEAAQKNVSVSEFMNRATAVIHSISQTRPTAVNLFWALDRMKGVLDKNKTQKPDAIHKALLSEAKSILEEDKEICRAMGRHGASLIPDGASILTHCNAGALATADYGTALGVIYSAVEDRKKLHVYADETRPLLQGARLTTWELMQSNIDVTLICDNTAAFVMQQKMVDMIFVGADRIALNGDTANKIGTYNLAVLADYHRIPFYIVAPTSTIDPGIASGMQIPIEERSPEEVTSGFGTRTAPQGVKVYSPAFDVTPHELITGIVTEKRIAVPPFHLDVLV